MSFTGVIPALLTPFDDDLRVAPERLTEHVRGLVDAGIEHVVVCGTMGEAAALSTDERRIVIATALAADVKVTVGISAADPAAVAVNAAQASALGAHGLMCLPPLTYDATEAELHAFYATATGAGDLP